MYVIRSQSRFTGETKSIGPTDDLALAERIAATNNLLFSDFTHWVESTATLHNGDNSQHSADSQVPDEK